MDPFKLQLALGAVFALLLAWALFGGGRGAMSPAVAALWQKRARFLLPLVLAYLALLLLGQWWLR